MDDKEEEPPPETPDLPTISNEIDRYISSLESGGDAVPIVMEKFLMLVEEKMDGYDSMESHVKWRRLREEDAAWFLDAVDRVTSLSNSLANLASDYKYAYTINRAGSVVQRAMSYLEGELKVLLEEYTADDADITSDLIRISKAMLAGSHKDECCHLYYVVRRDALEEHILQLGLEKLSIDNIHKKPWESLERDIELWILKFTTFAKDQFPAERNLLDSVFPAHPTIPETLFRGLTCGITKHILKFAEAVARRWRIFDA
ncbi:exocyst complex component EXO70B1-like [Salvia miltiorrhiza]|uniref:exocyst complex component EXO70B1-like n=1 Tax=Salvia miltiorrhiza TaxID=226208 RepID=UPI0025AD8EF6|nr:exocyst complex component EXO70B1-like [Salvia miltiorrhiza]